MTSLLDGELSDSDREAIESHITACRFCSEEFKSLSYSFQLIDSHLEDDDLEPPRWGRIKTQIGSSPERWFDRIWIRNWSWRPVAALAVLLLGFLVPFYWFGPAEPALYRSDSGESSNLQQRFDSYIREREQLESLHEEINKIEPVGWVSYNPYAVDARSSQRNPYARY